MSKKQIKKTIETETLEKLLSKQTLTILNAVDERLIKTEAKMDEKLLKLELKIDEKLLKMEERINHKFDKLTTTLDKFLKRILDVEDEMEIMKLDIIRLKKVVKEKIGVDLT